ncbi:MAG: DUF721 domain-containing protein [Lentisphaerae bacterium]|nr:DUF721 domain-containing protein [Lentisphaerota bacterium]
MNRRRRFDRTKWQLDRERFQITDHAPPAPDPGAPPVAAFIDEVLKGMKLAAHAQAGKIAAVWPELVGPQLAANTRPGTIENKLLTVYVSHPAWLMELRGGPGAEILSRVQERFGKKTVQQIRWAIDPGQAPR